jgi:hypothetical protein
VRVGYQAEAARRAAANGGAATREDEIVRALRAGDVARAARLRASAELLDHDYLAYWVDELGLRERWRALGD